MKTSLFLLCFVFTLSLHGAVYRTPTEQFKPRLEIATLYIEYQDQILLLHRQNHRPEGNAWGIPGGKVEKGETPLQAVIRETREETGFQFPEKSIEKVETLFIEYDATHHITYHMFRVKLEGDPSAVKINFEEHKGFTWITPKDALKLNLMKEEDTCFKLTYGLS